MAIDSKFNGLFTACKSTKTRNVKKQKGKGKGQEQEQGGGSYASDSVNGLLDAASFERINFLLDSGNNGTDGIVRGGGGGGCGCGISGSRGSVSSRHLNGGFLPPYTVADPIADAPGTMSASMMTSFAQPLSAHIPFNDVQMFPSYMHTFSPALANSF